MNIIMENQKTKWKQCPSCKKHIPEHWKKHVLCGWFDDAYAKEEVPQETKVDSKLASMVMSYVKDLVCAGKVTMKDFEKVHERLLKCLTQN